MSTGMESGVVNATMLVLARESRGLTQSELARRIGVTQATVSKVESGVTTPSSDLVSKYARELRYTETFFFDRAQKKNLPVTFHRKRKTLQLGIVRRVEADVNIRRLHLAKLLLSTEIPDFAIPPIDIGPETGFTPRQVARDIRIQRGIPRGPIVNMTAVLEDMGILVLRTDFGTPKIDGISIYDRSEGLPPIVFINTTSPGDRLRFTLAHELGHVVMHHHLAVPPMECEAEADAFASEFLMPADDIRPFLSRVTLDSLFSLKQHWKVSAAALILRAAQLGKIDARTKQRLFVRMNAQGLRDPEPNPIARDEPELVPELVDFHLQDLDYSEDEMSGLFGIMVDEFRANYRLLDQQPRLRLVHS